MGLVSTGICFITLTSIAICIAPNYREFQNAIESFLIIVHYYEPVHEVLVIRAPKLQGLHTQRWDGLNFRPLD